MLLHSKAAPQRVDFDRNLHDARVKQMARQGFNYRAIQEETDLTRSQVIYRMWKAGTRSYRSGETPEAKDTIKYIDRLLRETKSLQREFADVRHERRHRPKVSHASHGRASHNGHRRRYAGT